MESVKIVTGQAQRPMAVQKAEIPENGIHVVQEGQSIWKISQKYGIPFQDLLKANSHLKNPDLIHPGDEITLPGQAGKAEKAGEKPGVQAASKTEATQARNKTETAPAEQEELYYLKGRPNRILDNNARRLEEMEKTGKVPDAPPLKQANEDFKTVVDWMMKYPGDKPDTLTLTCQKDMEKARALYRKNPQFPLPVHLANVMANDDNVPQNVALSAVDFVRAYEKEYPSGN